jgi:hypothetical protein
MIDRVCPKCSGRAVAKVFKNEREKFAKLWECQRCLSVWGVPQWNYVARDLKDNFGLAPWRERECGNVTSHPCRRPVVIALLFIVVGTALFLRHQL